MTTVIADARRFADMHALYRMFDENGRLLYVGITGDLGQRLGDHSLKRWFPLVEAIRLEWHPNRAAALVAEKRAIGTERPRYNKAGFGPPKEAPKKTRPKRRAKIAKPEPSTEPRDLLGDLSTVMKDERMRIRDVVGMLRNLAPLHAPYQKMTGVWLVAELKRKGVRTINTGGRHYLDPDDLRKVFRRIAA